MPGPDEVEHCQAPSFLAMASLSPFGGWVCDKAPYPDAVSLLLSFSCRGSSAVHVISMKINGMANFEGKSQMLVKTEKRQGQLHGS